MEAAVVSSPRSDCMSDLPAELGIDASALKTSFAGVSWAGAQSLGMRHLDNLLLRQHNELRAFFVNYVGAQGHLDPPNGQHPAAEAVAPAQQLTPPLAPPKPEEAPSMWRAELATTPTVTPTGPAPQAEGRKEEPPAAQPGEPQVGSNLVSKVGSQGTASVSKSGSQVTGSDSKAGSHASAADSMAHIAWNFSEQELKSRARSKKSIPASAGLPGPADDRAGFCGGSSSVRQLVRHRYFEAGVAIAILLSSICVGIEVEYCALHQSGLAPWPFLALQWVFTLVFVAELALRVVADGIRFLKGRDRIWGLFDVVTAFIAVADLAINHIVTQPTAALIFVRIIRIVRIVRVIRMVRFLVELKLMIYSILATFRSLFWSLVLMSMVLYLCSVCLTQATTQHLSAIEGVPTAYAAMLKSEFGTLSRTGYTLFKSVMGGVSWGEPMQLLSNLHWVYFLVFLTYISFTMFAFLNVITGFFCENAFDLAEQDKEHVIQMQLANKAKYCSEFETIFEKMDSDRSGELTFDELEANLDSDAVVAYFQHLNLDVHQTWDIFRLLDLDGSGSISLTEFVEGCLKLRGPAKKVDVAEITYEVMKVQKKLGDFMVFVQHCFVALAKGEELPSPVDHSSMASCMP